MYLYNQLVHKTIVEALEAGIIALNFRMPCTENSKKLHYLNGIFILST